MKMENVMAELVREVENKDIPLIKDLLLNVFCDEKYVYIYRLGGMTNNSYKIVREDGGIYLVRIPGEGTEQLINRLDEKKSTKLACSLGIDSELIYFGDDGKKVMRFISNPKKMNQDVMKEHDNIRQAAEIFRKLHSCGVDTGVRFEVFEMATLYENVILDNHVKLYDDYYELKKQVMDIKSVIDKCGNNKKVPCHNDSLVDNWVLDENNRLWLVDWEYSGMNEPMWDLSCLSIEVGYDGNEDKELLKAYYGRSTTIEENMQFIATKIFVDYLWTLWGLTRVPYDGSFMQEYADNRYYRLKKNILLFDNFK